jgi:hypothetical protein
MLDANFILNVNYEVSDGFVECTVKILGTRSMLYDIFQAAQSRFYISPKAHSLHLALRPLTSSRYLKTRKFRFLPVMSRTLAHGGRPRTTLAMTMFG